MSNFFKLKKREREREWEENGQERGRRGEAMDEKRTINYK